MEGSMVKWERFVPKMGIRVLLVEDDDSTRHIIGALLRKCNYKVATVPDGLKAWEVLKARPHDIDLILTEVELPSISGYALLTLIMEQEICKNIPVIMMSKYDSVSTVYKCMLKGAADFLVKPIRINELKNLWQHVWRRESLNRGPGQLAESAGQPKREATAENDATSGTSSSSKACAKKGSDAQSSCGQPVLEAESAGVAPADEHPLQPELGKSALSDPNLLDTAKCSHNLSNPKLSCAIAGSEDNGFYNNNGTLDRDETLIPQNHVGNAIPHSEASNKVDIPADDSVREPIDLLGVLNSSCSLNDTAKTFDAPQLDLSLRRFYPSALENNTTCEKQTLNQSSTSAFTRYVSATVLTFTSNPTSVSHPQEDIVNSGDNLCEDAPCSISSPQDPLFPHGGKLRSSVSLPTNLTKEVENEYRNASQRLFPLPFPVTDSANNHMNFFNQFRLDIINGGCSLENRPPYSNQPIMKDQNYPTADQCATMAHREVVGSSRCENGNDEIQTPRDLKLERSMRREAALHKFRLKRKERCFEKKVRYESRKKLAEQRPRVKGQFVRQVAPDPPPPCISGVNSVIR